MKKNLNEKNFRKKKISGKKKFGGKKNSEEKNFFHSFAEPSRVVVEGEMRKVLRFLSGR